MRKTSKHEIFVPVDQLKIEGETVSGIVFFKHCDTCFPHVVWNDFPVVILAWWMESILLYLTTKQDYFCFDFMDGPVRILFCKRNDCLEASFIDKDEETKIGEVVIADLIANLIVVTSSVVVRLESTKYSSDDFLILKNALRKLQRLAKNIHRRN